jgi:hypothetical protein
MAEIKVEPKRGGLGWLWAIVLLVILGAALWYFFANSRPAPATTSPADSVRTSMIEMPYVERPTVAPSTATSARERKGEVQHA